MNIVKQTTALDNFGDYDDNIESADRESTRAAFVGDRYKFTNDAKWEDPNGVDHTGRQRVPTNIRRTEIKWGDGMPVEVVELQPGEKYRDLDALNESLPRSEWREGPDGKLHGPWVRQHVLELVDPETMDRFSWPTSTVGGSICIRELIEKIQWMRRFKGEGVFPLVALSHKFMNTRFGGRERPFLDIRGWVRIGPGGIENVSDSPQLQHVSEPTLRDESKDSIPY